MSPFSTIEVAPEIIAAARRGEPGAHESIFRACQRPVYTLIRRLIPRAAVADDLFQDTFVEILRSIHTYSGEGSFGGWIRSIAVSKCLMYLRSPWHRSLLWLDDAEDPRAELIAADAGPEEGAESQADLVRALASLPALTRSVVWLHDVEGYTHPEIARLLGRTVSFSKSQLSRAHARLRTALGSRQQAAPNASDASRSTSTPSSMSRVGVLEEDSSIARLEPIRD